ncbi:peptidyl-prolyl cis-trans isomerase FKBP53 [Cucumis melo var. makuwa]|uniref:peptidylprolyl isomerase n=1 Tax=Cucumis melo var. makuwa TaxID=1194695 RepID=A0A5D3DJ81_CUCMM|nr:peptidyl-prolyl cis-trans isomerase FKBP53 [Cucumis melo var. makuwa]TYK23694.1 peptidyl-prolyl cis-trans isomerase FKBP53 [Cucumis melo var. makuwa]
MDSDKPPPMQVVRLCFAFSIQQLKTLHPERSLTPSDSNKRDCSGFKVAEQRRLGFYGKLHSTSTNILPSEMGFWGIEVKPGKPYSYHSDNVTGKLRITQATLGPGSSKERSIVQCSVGNKSPIFLCSLIPNKIESCPLDLEFEEDDSIAFSVIGPQSIHLSGYFVANEGHVIGDDTESDSFGEDIAETDTEDSSEYDTGDEYDDEFIDDDDDYPGMYSTSPVPKSGVVIEEIVDDEKSNDANGQAKKVKKNKSSDSEDIRNSQRQIVLKRNVETAVSESEDEDGFPIPTKGKSKANIQKLESKQEQKSPSTEDVKETKAKDGNDVSSLKRKVENDEQVDHMESILRGLFSEEKWGPRIEFPSAAEETRNDGDMGSEKQQAEDDSAATNLISDGDEKDKKISEQRDASIHPKVVDGENHKEDKQKKKTKKKGKKSKEAEAGSKSDELTKTAGDRIESALGSKEKEKESKPSRVRTFANGLVIEDVAMGKPDGKRASPGNMVSVHYIGKLKNGKIFDSNIGRAPFKFRLGVGQVIKGWDVGVNGNYLNGLTPLFLYEFGYCLNIDFADPLSGMRIGDKRRLTIPPSMGYGDAKIGRIPQNSWLTFDVELVGVR